MTNTSAQPLEIKHDQVDPAILKAIQGIDQIARECGLSYFLAGATAREIVLRHVFGRPPGRRTFDVDFGIAVETWEEFATLKTALVDRGNFVPHPKQKQRLIDTTNEAVVDLIPFGGIERDGSVSWPPDGDIVMKVTGFKDAFESAVPVRLASNLTVPVVTLPLLLALKLFAWRDRKQEKRDAVDIYTLLREYCEAGNEDRLYGEKMEILEAEEFNVKPAGAILLGLDMGNSVSDATREQLAEILKSDDEMSQLIDQIITSNSSFDHNEPSQCELLVRKMRQGFFGK